jgi:hypothetical protein
MGDTCLGTPSLEVYFSTRKSIHNARYALSLFKPGSNALYLGFAKTGVCVDTLFFSFVVRNVVVKDCCIYALEHNRHGSKPLILLLLFQVHRVGSCLFVIVQKFQYSAAKAFQKKLRSDDFAQMKLTAET